MYKNANDIHKNQPFLRIMKTVIDTYDRFEVDYNESILPFYIGVDALYGKCPAKYFIPKKTEEPFDIIL